MKKYVSRLGKLYDVAEAENGYLMVLDHDRDVDPMRDEPCVACCVFTEEDIEPAVKKYEDEERYTNDEAFFLVNGIKFFSRDIQEQTGHSCFGDLEISLIADVFEEFTINEGKSFNTESLKQELAECEYTCFMKGYIKEDECNFYKVTDLDRLAARIIEWEYDYGAWDTDIFVDDHWKEYYNNVDDMIYGMEQSLADCEKYTPEETEHLEKGKNLLAELKAYKARSN